MTAYMVYSIMPYIDLPVKGGTVDVVSTVTTFVELPDPASNFGKVYTVVSNSGVWPINFKAKGLYVSDGVKWVPFEYDEYAIKYCDNLQAQINSIQTQSANNVIANFPCGSNVSVGDWVISSSGIAAPAIASSFSTSNVMGVCESKDSSNICTIRVSGVTSSIYSGLDPTKNYFLSADTLGAMVPEGGAIPSQSGQILLNLGQPIDDTKFLVNKGTRIIRS